MIKNWSKFNESSSEAFTEEMSQEILYFFGEDSKVSKEIGDIFNRIYKTYNLNHIVFYETGYDEMKEFTKYLFDRSKENPELTQNLIDLYHKIRQKISIFPEVYQIEDMYLSIIEDLNYDFYLDIDCARNEMAIKLKKWEESELSQFIETCKIVEGSLKRLKSDKYTTKLESCAFNSSYIEFEINLKA
jgi:predicted RecB family nuclease